MAEEERPFLSRWALRKAQVRRGELPAEPEGRPPAATAALPVAPRAPAAIPAAAPVAAPAPVAADVPPPAPALTMNDVAELTPASDYSRFVAPEVNSGVRNAAMKKLFSDPHFNVMDGLDIYIGDYSQPDPIPPDMLRKMVQSKFLGLFDAEEKAEAEAAEQAAAAAADTAAGASGTDADTGGDGAHSPAPAEPADVSGGELAAADNPAHDDHTDLQLQPDDAARRASADQGAGAGEV